jgi:hypothetical protein
MVYQLLHISDIVKEPPEMFIPISEYEDELGVESLVSILPDVKSYA